MSLEKPGYEWEIKVTFDAGYALPEFRDDTNSPQPSRDWLKMGYTHVIPKGHDHLLFILALFLLARKWKPLLTQSLVFTLAHSMIC